MARLQFKFVEQADQDARGEIIDRIAAEQGVTFVEPVFPGEPNPKLRALYFAEATDAASFALLQRLNSDDLIEFAEADVARGAAGQS